MKYLKVYEAYKLFEGNGDDMLFLNRDLIADLKDLCMEQLDNNYSLILQFFESNNPVSIAYAIINHSINDYIWWNSYVRDIKSYNSNLGKIKYQWGLKGVRVYIDKDVISEIEYRIRAMYPEEDINYLAYR